VEQEPLDPEPTVLSLGKFVLDYVQIAVVHIHGVPVDLQPGAAVEDAAAPAAYL
jgi:hypothetical protein